jgi:hypothetical protein
MVLDDPWKPLVVVLIAGVVYVRNNASHYFSLD